VRYQSSEAVRAATGRDWSEWFDLLDAAGAPRMTHKQITTWLHDNGHLSGMWCQAVVTTYEQETGRRQVGQTCDGDWNAGARRVVAAPPDHVFERWCDEVAGERSFNGVELAGEPSVNITERFHYWRATLADGSRLDVNVYRNRKGEVSLNISHKKLPSKQASDSWKTYWKSRLRALTL
jgi:hypothetical protein